jgi:hypothetical protein
VTAEHAVAGVGSRVFTFTFPPSQAMVIVSPALLVTVSLPAATVGVTFALAAPGRDTRATAVTADRPASRAVLLRDI